MMVPVSDDATAPSHADAETSQEQSENLSVTVDNDKITQWKSLLLSFAVLLLTMKGTYSLSESCIMHCLNQSSSSSLLLSKISAQEAAASSNQ